MSNETPTFDPNQDPEIHAAAMASIENIEDAAIREGARFIWQLCWYQRTLQMPLPVAVAFSRQDQRQRGGQPMDPLQVQ